MRVQYKVKQSPCNCVFRSVFRVCLARFRECAVSESYAATVSWDYFAAGGRRVMARKKEEYMADFYLIAKRTLGPLELRVLRFYHLLGADWKLCSRRLGMDRGSFFHVVYRLEEKLGKAYAETEPYPLYPISEYFGGTAKPERTTAYVADPVAEREALRVPMLMTA
jgi:hypothetical protein